MCPLPHPYIRLVLKQEHSLHEENLHQAHRHMKRGENNYPFIQFPVFILLFSSKDYKETLRPNQHVTAWLLWEWRNVNWASEENHTAQYFYL